MTNYKCSECGFIGEYAIGKSIPKEMQIPEICPKCKKGKMEMQFSNCGNIGIDVVGGYEYQYGKKSKLYKDVKHRADVISDRNKNPY